MFHAVLLCTDFAAEAFDILFFDIINVFISMHVWIENVSLYTFVTSNSFASNVFVNYLYFLFGALNFMRNFCEINSKKTIKNSMNDGTYFQMIFYLTFLLQYPFKVFQKNRKWNFKYIHVNWLCLVSEKQIVLSSTFITHFEIQNFFHVRRQ